MTWCVLVNGVGKSKIRHTNIYKTPALWKWNIKSAEMRILGRRDLISNEDIYEEVGTCKINDKV